jgi:hypothetical protein
MKFAAKIAERVLAVELQREIFVGRETHCHKSAATSNAQRPTSNAEFPP